MIKAKLIILLVLINTVLTACSQGVFSLTKPELQAVAPDVPLIPKITQKQAAIEMQEYKCPAENIIINQCLITRDEARALKK